MCLAELAAVPQASSPTPQKLPCEPGTLSFDFGFNCFVLLGLPVCLFVYFLHTSRDGSWRLLRRLRVRLRMWQLENQDSSSGYTGRRVTKSTVIMLSWQPE